MIHKSFALAAVIAALPLCAGCRTNNESIFIRQVPVPDPQNKCIVSADPAQLALSTGTFDTSFGDRYRQFFLVGNQLVPRGDASRLRPETSRVVFDTAEVEIFLPPNEQPIDTQSVAVAGFADPANETTPGFGLVLVDPLISKSVGQSLAGAKFKTPRDGVTVVARVVIKGKTLGGLNEKTGPFDYPIFVCGNATSHIPCVGLPSPPSCTDQIDPACILGQDSPHDCREVQQAYRFKIDCRDAMNVQCPCTLKDGKACPGSI